MRGRMTADRELTDGQRTYLRGLPLYPWAVWTYRLNLGVFACMFALFATGSSLPLMAAALLLYLPLTLVGGVLYTIVLNQLRRFLEIQGFFERAHLSRAVNRLVYRDALLGRRPRK
ncbi:hypothetical protein ODJ79_27560 [Actinoplanes sp. KI2]|uniref:hypothetical protein n=1 Tax=Actinoplanes sp. KI2 TaxID=2983315 RepID=UPI0021D60991|nr:hypothetical protein [Actinoplanes sp. KI2]MCU7727494.1 hypothetical protein [Actinoplanes sp. KI2]